MRLGLSSIKLQFSYKSVLQGVDCNFEEGQIHALIGENGQGKSTLARIICGEIKADSGNMFLDDADYTPQSVHQALENGVVMVRQRPLLAGSVTIKENLLLGLREFQDKTAGDILNQFCPTLKLSKKVQGCSGDQRFFIALTGALLRNPKILILDEPSALLTQEQTVNLYKKLSDLAKTGMNIIVITHFPEELKYAHTVTKLINGKAISYSSSEIPGSSTSPAKSQNQTEYSKQIEETSQKVKHLFFPTLAALTDAENRLFKENPGCSYIPSDKSFRGSHPDLTIAQLLTSCYKGPWKNRQTYIHEIIKKAQIEIKPSEKVRALSGGMLQRLILERELSKNSHVVIMAEPFQGLDTERVQFMKNRIDELASQGKTVYVLKTGAPQ